jgi:hypothetical protein
MVSGGERFDVDVIEDAAAARLRYRDAVRLANGDVLLVMTELAAGDPTAPSFASWKQSVRQAAAKGKGPNEILRVLNQDVFDSGLKVSAVCARLALGERLLTVARAGAPPPIVLRASGSIAPGDSAPTVLLGQVRAAQFGERSLGFERGDTALVGSSRWAAILNSALPRLAARGSALAPRLRELSQRLEGGSLLCLSFH